MVELDGTQAGNWSRQGREFCPRFIADEGSIHSNSQSASLLSTPAIFSRICGVGSRRPLTILLSMVSSVPSICASRFCRMPVFQIWSLRLGYMIVHFVHKRMERVTARTFSVNILSRTRIKQTEGQPYAGHAVSIESNQPGAAAASVWDCREAVSWDFVQLFGNAKSAWVTARRSQLLVAFFAAGTGRVRVIVRNQMLTKV